MPIIVFAYKECTKCGEDKPIFLFYRHPKNKSDGRSGKCIDCTKVDVRMNYSAKRERYSEYERIRNQQPDRRLKKAIYQINHRTRNAGKYKARNAVSNALRDGKISRDPCVYCGANDKVQAHHSDYDRPLSVTWTCFRCHRENEHGQTVVAA